MVRLTNRPDMTIAVDLDDRHQTKPKSKHCVQKSSTFSSGGHFVQHSGTIYVISVERRMINVCVFSSSKI